MLKILKLVFDLGALGDSNKSNSTLNVTISQSYWENRDERMWRERWMKRWRKDIRKKTLNLNTF